MFYDDIETRAPKAIIHRDRRIKIIDPFVSTVLFDSEHLSFRYSRDHHYHTAAAILHKPLPHGRRSNFGYTQNR
jgi:hypothetical protein